MKKLLSLVAIVAAQFSFGQSTTFTSAPTSAETGETITVSINFDTGSTEQATHAYYELRDVTGGTNTWKYGQNISLNTPTASGTHTTTTFTIPSTLDPDADYKLIANYRIGEAWGTGISQDIDIIAGDSWVFGDNLEFVSGTTIDVPIKYTSDTDIAAGGIKFAMWTETRGTVSETNIFSDIWYGVFTNTTILPAGTNVETTININVPANAINSATGTAYLSSDLGANWDPNAGDAGKNYVNHATTPATTYTFMFRSVLGTDPNFQVIPGSADFTIVGTLSSSSYKKLEGGISPNPTTGVLNIANVDGIKNISILSLTGQKLKSFNAANSIDISDLASGVYILLTDNGQYQKVIKK